LAPFPLGSAPRRACFEKPRFWHELQIQPDLLLGTIGLIAVPLDDKDWATALS
jgi:hypothetical protein